MDTHGIRKVDRVRGLIIYRSFGKKLEFLLLKKRLVEDWGPPKGKQDGTENEIETAQRETEEETSLIEQDYQLLNSRIYFEYRNPTNVLKKVTLWPAKLICSSKVIQISKEHEEYCWLPIDEAGKFVKNEYREALRKAAHIIRNQDQLSKELNIVCM